MSEFEGVFRWAVVRGGCGLLSSFGGEPAQGIMKVIIMTPEAPGVTSVAPGVFIGGDEASTSSAVASEQSKLWQVPHRVVEGERRRFSAGQGSKDLGAFHQGLLQMVNQPVRRDVLAPLHHRGSEGGPKGILLRPVGLTEDLNR